MIKKAEYFNLLSTTTPTVTTDTVMPALVAIPTPSSQRKLRRDFYSNEWLAYPEILRPVTLKGFMAHPVKDQYVALDANNHGILMTEMRTEAHCKIHVGQVSFKCSC